MQVYNHPEYKYPVIQRVASYQCTCHILHARLGRRDLSGIGVTSPLLSQTSPFILPLRNSFTRSRPLLGSPLALESLQLPRPDRHTSRTSTIITHEPQGETGAQKILILHQLSKTESKPLIPSSCRRLRTVSRLAGCRCFVRSFQKMQEGLYYRKYGRIAKETTQQLFTT